MVVSSVRSTRACLLAAVLLLCTPRAHAVPTALERNLAEQLFLDGKRLMGEGNYEDGCPKLAESQRLDPGGGTILNLAVCHAAQGLYASAWSEFREAIDIARTDGRTDREEFALKELAKVEARLSHLTIVVERPAETPDLVVTLDGQVIGPAAWGAPFPIDPGVHEIVASAPGRKARRATVRVGATNDSKAVSIGVLEQADPVRPAASNPEPISAVETAPARANETIAMPRAAPATSSSGSRTVAFVVTGAGVAVLGAGVFAGVWALDRRAESDRYCSGETCVSPRGVALNEDAQRFANVANVGIGVGVATLILGTYLLVSSSSGGSDASTAVETTSNQSVVRVTPVVGRRDGGVRLSASW